MERLASPVEAMGGHYDVVVIGSGYGGAITASRLARAGRRVAVLERGKELHPGEYPDTLWEARSHFQIHTAGGRTLGPRSALYELHLGDDISVFKGCGLGGTSLVNANVALRPDPRVFDDPVWPAELRGADKRLAAGFERAEAMLRPTLYPDDEPALPKLAALESAAKAVGGTFRRLPINVTFTNGTNHVGVEQRACNGCGDCVSGCNHGAKNTLLMNYLPDARAHGAEIFCEVDVRHVEPAAPTANGAGGWVVRYQPLDERAAFDPPLQSVAADVVVLAAGTLGSTEILLRSRDQRGVPMSDALGTRFSGNGDVLGFAYNTEHEINGIGFGHRRAHERQAVGPCITGLIERRGATLDDTFIIEDGSIPGALAPPLPLAFSIAANVDSEPPEPEPILDQAGRAARIAASLVGGAYHGATRNTETFLVVGHDGSDGRLVLDDDGDVEIQWPGLGEQPRFRVVSDALEAAADALDGEFVPNPLSVHDKDRPLVTVHPLGGCPMGDDATTAVVDHKGRVFAGRNGTDVHDGLYVADAAIIPRSLGVNPLLTISALAERNAALLAEDRGWAIDQTLDSAPAPADAEGDERDTEPVRAGLRFAERMTGWISTTELDDFTTAERDGEARNSPIRFVVRIMADDLDAFLSDPSQSAELIGTVEAPALAPGPLRVTDGTFHLFVGEPSQRGTSRMRYSMALQAEDGRRFDFEGFKEIQAGPLREAWRDTTTLYVSIREYPETPCPDASDGAPAEEWPVTACVAGERQQNDADESGPLLAVGIMKISPIDVARLLTKMRVTRARSATERLEGLAGFGRVFAGELLEDYGGIFARPVPLDPDAPPRRRRPLECGVPEVHEVVTADGVRIRLLRYHGGDRGPVVCSHGMGACSGLFNLDTVKPNLTEYLWSQGFDVWLLDWRASVLLPAANTLFTADQCARYDYPAAAAKVMEVTGADELHWVVHCVGSIVFYMSALSYLDNVASVAALQVAMHQDAPALTDAKIALHLPQALLRLGIDRIDARTIATGTWKDRLFNQALRFYPIEADQHCASAVCKRITFLYSLCYQHENLNDETHDTMHERMGIANLKMMEQLARCTRRGHVVSAQGRDTYMPNLDRLAGIPMTFLHGALNRVWKPASTERSLAVLSDRFGRELYERHVLGGYGHFEALFGRSSAQTSYPLILDHLVRAGA